MLAFGSQSEVRCEKHKNRDKNIMHEFILNQITANKQVTNQDPQGTPFLCLIANPPFNTETHRGKHHQSASTEQSKMEAPLNSPTIRQICTAGETDWQLDRQEETLITHTHTASPGLL